MQVYSILIRPTQQKRRKIISLKRGGEKRSVTTVVGAIVVYLKLLLNSCFSRTAHNVGKVEEKEIEIGGGSWQSGDLEK